VKGKDASVNVLMRQTKAPEASPPKLW